MFTLAIVLIHIEIFLTKLHLKRNLELLESFNHVLEVHGNVNGLRMWTRAMNLGDAITMARRLSYLQVGEPLYIGCQFIGSMNELDALFAPNFRYCFENDIQIQYRNDFTDIGVDKSFYAFV